MRVFLDTNVLASAVGSRGLCADVLREVFASHDLVTSEVALDELRGVLRDKFGVAHRIIAETQGLLRQDAIIARPGAIPSVRASDPADLAILSSALSGKAEVFVTGDKELLDIGRIGDLEILSPRQFWERLISKAPRRGKRRRPSRLF